MPFKDIEKRRAAGRAAVARFRERMSEQDRQKARAASRKWRENNREKHRGYCKSYRIAHKATCACGAKMDRRSTECGSCALRRKGSDSKAWRGGAITTSAGYRLVMTPEHPNATKAGYVPEHRLVMERQIGRYLLPDETVHHRNGVRLDNRPENLELWSSKHPHGQRVVDLIAWAREILVRYSGLPPQVAGEQG